MKNLNYKIILITIVLLFGFVFSINTTNAATKNSKCYNEVRQSAGKWQPSNRNKHFYEEVIRRCSGKYYKKVWEINGEKVELVLLYGDDFKPVINDIKKAGSFAKYVENERAAYRKLLADGNPNTNSKFYRDYSACLRGEYGNRTEAWCANNTGVNITSTQITCFNSFHVKLLSKPVPKPDCTGINVNVSAKKVTCTGKDTNHYNLYVDNHKIKTNTTGIFQGDYFAQVIANPDTYNIDCRVDGESVADNECKQPITVDPTPVCNGLTVPTPLEVTTPTTKTISCSASQTEKIIIDCGNGQTQTFTGDKTGEKTVTKKCTYTEVKDYHPTCKVDGETTAVNSCKKTLKVTEPKFDLALRKTITSDAPYNIGDIVTYNIAVINQGSIDAENIEITDYIPTEMKLVSGDDWSTMGTDRKVTKRISSINSGETKNLTIKLKILSGTSTITNYAEISEDNNDDCDSTADNNRDNDGTITDDDIGNGCNSGGDEDDHDIAVITLGGTFDLALRKTTITTGPYNIGDTVRYKIEVFNQGTLKATDVEVTDYIPNQMELVSGKIKTIIHEILPGKSKSIYIRLKIKSGIADGASIKNYAEISEDHATDCDSEADATNGNQTGEEDSNIDDNEIGSRCDSSDDEDDHDIEIIQIGDESTFCRAVTTGAQSFPISSSKSGLCEKTGEEVINFSTSVSGKTTNYVWSCKDTSGIIHTGGNCSASYTSGGGGGGGSSAKCYNIEKDGNQYTCIGNRKTRTIGIDCDGDGKYEQVKYQSSFTENDNKTIYSYKFTCDPGTDADGKEKIIAPKCAVSKQTISANQTSGWNSNFQCKYIVNNTCGDGNVDNGEECDGGASCYPKGHSKECKLKAKSHGYSGCKLTDTDYNKCCSKTFKYYNANNEECDKTSTRPSGGEVEITTVSNFAIGNNQKVFNYVNSKNIFNSEQYEGVSLQIRNIGDEPIILNDTLCVIDKGNNKRIIGTSDKECDSQEISFLPADPSYYYYFRKDISELFKGKSDNISTGNSETTKLVLTVEDGSTGKTFEWSPILSGNMFITVAKPSIAGQGGGTTYLENTNISSVNEIADKVNSNGNGVDINTNQNNFVATVLGDGTDLSDVDTINTIDNSDNYGDSDTFNIENTTIDSYKGLSNVYSVKGNVKSSDILGEGGKISKTFIIEGNLTIDENIESNKNIAFIVKGGNILIEKKVTRIDGTYVNIGGEISSENTDNTLTVNGTIYGNTKKLVDNRTHISMDKNGNINVGTIVNYGSNILNKPAPLVGQFVGEYMNSEKFAK